MTDIKLLVPALDRILLISWLLKDFGWMTTNVYLGWPFRTAAVIFHAISLCTDPRSSYRFYDLSFLFWISGMYAYFIIMKIAIITISLVYSRQLDLDDG